MFWKSIFPSWGSFQCDEELFPANASERDGPVLLLRPLRQADGIWMQVVPGMDGKHFPGQENRQGTDRGNKSWWYPGELTERWSSLLGEAGVQIHIQEHQWLCEVPLLFEWKCKIIASRDSRLLKGIIMLLNTGTYCLSPLFPPICLDSMLQRAFGTRAGCNVEA